jgi:hypothetical protein
MREQINPGMGWLFKVRVVPFHLSLTVTDIERSATYYQEWLGFGPEDRRVDDETIFVRLSEGTDLALHAGEVPTSLDGQVIHFGSAAVLLTRCTTCRPNWSRMRLRLLHSTKRQTLRASS